jgi:hypothetical protein
MGSWDSLSRIPFTSACQFAFIRRVPTDKGGFPVERVFATKGSDLEKTSFGDGASLLARSMPPSIPTSSSSIGACRRFPASTYWLIRPDWHGFSRHTQRSAGTRVGS